MSNSISSSAMHRPPRWSVCPNARRRGGGRARPARGGAPRVGVGRLPEVLAEMVRVAAPGAAVALTLPTASSFGEFYSIYWEALLNADMLDESPIVEQLIQQRPTVSDMDPLAARERSEERRVG